MQEIEYIHTFSTHAHPYVKGAGAHLVADRLIVPLVVPSEIVELLSGVVCWNAKVPWGITTLLPLKVIVLSVSTKRSEPPELCRRTEPLALPADEAPGAMTTLPPAPASAEPAVMTTSPPA